MGNFKKGKKIKIIIIGVWGGHIEGKLGTLFYIKNYLFCPFIDKL